MATTQLNNTQIIDKVIVDKNTTNTTTSLNSKTDNTITNNTLTNNGNSTLNSLISTIKKDGLSVDIINKEHLEYTNTELTQVNIKDLTNYLVQTIIGTKENITDTSYNIYCTDLSLAQLRDYELTFVVGSNKKLKLPANSIIISSPTKVNSNNKTVDKGIPAICITDKNSHILPLTYSFNKDQFEVNLTNNTVSLKETELTQRVANLESEVEELKRQYLALTQMKPTMQTK